MEGTDFGAWRQPRWFRGSPSHPKSQSGKVTATEVFQSLIVGGFHIFNMGKPSPDWRVILRGLEFGGGGKN